MPVLMSIDGIRGPGIIEGYDGWLLLNAFKWGGSRAIQKRADQRGRMGAFVVAPQLKAVTVSREADIKSPELWQLMTSLSRKPVRFVWLRTGDGGALVPYLEVAISNALIVAAGHNATFTQPEETIEFTYDAVEIRVVNIGNTLTGPQDVVSYSLPDATRA